jgi:glycerophosphoryl diester phosphodiesterase
LITLPDRTLVFGHRGASAYRPQNTLAAFLLAAEQRADGIELDVHLSSDGYPVVIHDFTVEHTTNGQGAVSEMTLAQLKSLDAGSWMDAKHSGTQVPTLDEVFAAVGDKLMVNVEIKADTPEIERVVAETIARFHMQDRAIVSSFNPQILKRFRGVVPEVAVGFLYVPMEGFDPRVVLAEMRHEAVHPYHEIITDDYMKWAKQEGYIVNTWTVNDPKRARELRDSGVNVIITDKPDEIIKALASDD